MCIIGENQQGKDHVSSVINEAENVLKEHS